jgi:hypothetical protein
MDPTGPKNASHHPRMIAWREMLKTPPRAAMNSSTSGLSKVTRNVSVLFVFKTNLLIESQATLL